LGFKSDLDAREALRSEDSSTDVQQTIRDFVTLQIQFGLYPQLALRALKQAGNPGEALCLARYWKPDFEHINPAALDRACELLDHYRVRIVPYHSSYYPERLSRLTDAPAVLFVRGKPDVLQRSSVAIVGSRAATVYGSEVAQRLGRALSEVGVVVVSGLARGIDAAAHRGALEAKGVTMAIQACGLDRVYPAEHLDLAEQILERGALVTEFPPEVPPRRFHFPLRNRVISALAKVVVVVEAREKSGSLITAEHALEQGVELMAVPGPITSPTSMGPNRMIRDGAAPVLEPLDVLRALGLEDAQGSIPYPSTSPPSLSEIALEILDGLEHEPLSREELFQRSKRPVEQIVRGLVELQMERFIAEDRDGRIRRCSR